jgi:hypothetical protein
LLRAEPLHCDHSQNRVVARVRSSNSTQRHTQNHKQKQQQVRGVGHPNSMWPQTMIIFVAVCCGTAVAAVVFVFFYYAYAKQILCFRPTGRRTAATLGGGGSVHGGSVTGGGGAGRYAAPLLPTGNRELLELPARRTATLADLDESTEWPPPHTAIAVAPRELLTMERSAAADVGHSPAAAALSPAGRPPAAHVHRDLVLPPAIDPFQRAGFLVLPEAATSSAPSSAQRRRPGDNHVRAMPTPGTAAAAAALDSAERASSVSSNSSAQHRRGIVLWQHDVSVAHATAARLGEELPEPVQLEPFSDDEIDDDDLGPSAKVLSLADLAAHLNAGTFASLPMAAALKGFAPPGAGQTNPKHSDRSGSGSAGALLPGPQPPTVTYSNRAVSPTGGLLTGHNSSGDIHSSPVAAVRLSGALQHTTTVGRRRVKSYALEDVVGDDDDDSSFASTDGKTYSQ